MTEEKNVVKVRVHDVKSAEFVQEEGWKANYAVTESQQKLHRVNVMGVLLNKDVQGTITTFIIDDGSGSISIRSFDVVKNIDTMNIGDGILVIGRIREYSGENYISPEILRAIDKQWLNVRRLELQIPEVQEKVEEEVEETLPTLKLLEIVREMDSGPGVLIDDVIEKSSLHDTEGLLQKLMESGELFQNQPGRVKVL